MNTRTVLFCAAVSVLSQMPAHGQETTPTITTSDDACFETTQTATLEGNGAVGASSLYPMVRAAADPEWWVQPQAMIATDGSWDGLIYLGEPGRHYVDYRVRIVVDPNPPIRVGKYGARTPSARFISRAITVRKQSPGSC